MNDTELDELLWHARPKVPLGDGIDEATTGLVYSSKAHVGVGMGKPTRHRRPLLIAAVAAGAIVLTAGASVTAAQLGIPPFQGIEAGTQRLATAAPIDYVETDGTSVTCKAFLEFRNLNSSEQATVESAVASYDWSRVGQAAYDRAHDAATTAEDRSILFGDRIAAELYKVGASALPGLTRTSADSRGHEVLYNGYGMSCTPQNTW